MHDRVQALELLALDSAGLQIPVDLPGRLDGRVPSSDEAHHLVAAGGEKREQRSAQETAGPAHSHPEPIG